MIGHIIAAKENTIWAAFEAEGNFGYLGIRKGFASLSKGDVIEGEIDRIGITSININGEGVVLVNIMNYGIKEKQAIKAVEKLSR